MKRMTILALVLVLALGLCACANDAAPETTAAATTAAATPSTEAPAELPPLGLQTWSLTTSTWSSPNGATVHLTATPHGYAEGRSVSFVVRLDEEEAANVPCEWDGSAYTASADLNAADGLCYYVLMQDADGNSAEVPVNEPSMGDADLALINMATALQSYCDITVEESSYTGSELTLTTGTASVQLPTITNNGEAVTCQEAALVLSFNGQELAKEALTLSATDTAGLLEASLAGITFEVPEMEEDQRLELSMNAVLSNGQTLTAFGGDWFYNAEGLLPVVG